MTNTLEYMDETSFILDTTWMGEEKRIQEDVPLATLDEVMQALEKKIEEGYIVISMRSGWAMSAIWMIPLRIFMRFIRRGSAIVFMPIRRVNRL